MKRDYLYLCLFLGLSLLASCQKYVVEDDAAVVVAGGDGQLIVRTSEHVSGSTDTDDNVNYPVSVYVLDSEGQCVALQTIATADDALSFELEEGTYDVCAVAGTDSYSLPTAVEATATTVLKPKDGGTHGDLMTAYNSVTLTKGEENRLTLNLQRRVMLVESMTLNNIPDDVTEVRFTISPIYNNVLLGGGYAEGTGSHTFTLVRQADGSTWKNAASEYVLECKNTVTMKVALVRESGTTSYSYAGSERLAANYKVNITGNFIDDEHIKLSGTVSGTGWTGTIDIVFDFDSTNITNPDAGDGDTQEILHGDAPQAGTLYNGCYVLRTVNSGNTTTVTLMTPKEENKIKISKSKDAETVQESIKTNTAAALKNVSMSGVTGWRLPTQEEVEYIDSHLDAINERISALGTNSVTVVTLQSSGYYCGYFFTDTDGNVYVYQLGDHGIDKEPSSERATYKVRGFTTVSFTD